MSRARVNPFDQGTAERTLFAHFRRNKAAAEAAEQAAALAATEGSAYRSAAERYAEALRALGHGDKVTPLKSLPNFAPPSCTMCDDTGRKDHASFAMEPCDHGSGPQASRPAADAAKQ